MMNNTVKTQNIELVPFDCWCLVILFFRDPKDFLSLVTTIKGLYEHIKKLSPHCTINVEFRCTIPSEKMNFKLGSPHVSNLYVKSSYKPVFFAFARTFSKFRSLMKLKANIRQHAPKHLYLDSSLEKWENNHLVHLNINAASDLSFDCDFRKLETLRLVNSKTEGKKYGKKVVHKILRINFEKLKSLNRLLLLNWKVKCIPKRYFSRSDEKLIPFFRLKELFFKDITFRFSQIPLRACKKLEILRLKNVCFSINKSDHLSLKVLEIFINEQNQKTWQVITNFPVLQKLVIKTADTISKRSIFVIRELPRLEVLKIENLSKLMIEYRLVSLPNLKSLCSLPCDGSSGNNDIRFPDPKTDLPVLEKLQMWVDGKSNIGFLANLIVWKRTLKEIRVARTPSMELLDREIVFIGFLVLEKVEVVNIEVTEVSNCPFLRILVLRGEGNIKSLRVTNCVMLKRLRIEMENEDGFHDHVCKLVRLEGLPSLEELRIEARMRNFFLKGVNKDCVMEFKDRNYPYEDLTSDISTLGTSRPPWSDSDSLASSSDSGSSSPSSSSSSSSSSSNSDMSDSDSILEESDSM